VAAVGFFLILSAGRHEARGELVSAARLVRLGGWPALAGAVSLALLSCRGDRMTIGAALAFCLSGFAGLLAGLSGKPRPTGQVAALMFIAGLIMIAAAI
jgi:hypothetical protein